MTLAYDVDLALIPPALAGSFVRYGPDADTADFLDACRKDPPSGYQEFLEIVLSFFLPDYEVHGLLGLYSMHLLSERQWSDLVGAKRGGTLLDVGAGQGFVTERAKGMFSTIDTTETAYSMARTLDRAGLRCARGDLGERDLFPGRQFDVISILNVLDRCSRPLSLLRNCLRMLASDGLLLIASPLPLKPRVRGATIGASPLESLPTPPAEAAWEKCFVHFYENIVRANDLEIVRWTRLPYLWKTVRPACVSGLDDVVMVCRVARTAERGV